MEDPNAYWPDIDIDPYPNPSYKWVPFCYICCSGFTTVPGDHSLGRDTYSRPNASEITYTAHELEDLHALTYPGWRTLFRLIMFDSKSRSYKLSGISQNFYPWRKFHAPWNENDGLISVGNYKRIWRHRLAAPKLVQCKENIEKQSSLAGYLVHARCWREFLRVNNWHHLTKESLGILSRALRMRCLKECLYIYYDDPVESFLMMEPRDPIGMTSVRRFVTRCRNRAKIKASNIPCSIESWLIRLPMELQYMVMDYLSYEDVCSVLEGIQWTVDKGYWKLRLNLNLFSEIQSILHEDLDWRWLCLKLEVLEHSQAGVDRKRFFTLLEEIAVQYGLTKTIK
ncbi:hypothetical protein BO83DRAFT_384704 [Aspergillus eucalypticola CBS 122712]|uniref:F-box domain-containing protein n=1 Tax=Aspergillus eucalypticola (strain CBS 122712 / IBT 29274) TaxID=1448314 RepID=A0A317WGV0_ASPEC|nr:uncharacterized protein BO83DRAFT_384704 [Aspergillus eucalypticola CBS 122712]PWY84278.1 hypothetical protein BO83DRAFT_384704 [Aspergillus eucalypticola CBS 122712]